MLHQHDVIVVGAGPSGSAVAHYLAQQGLNVLLLDKSEFPRDKTCGDGLTPRALPILRDMGILDQVMHVGYPLDRLAVTSPAGSTSVISIPALPHAPSYALIVPRFQLDNLIRERAIQSGATFRGGTHVNNVTATDEAVTVNTSAGELTSRMVVVAVGATTRLLTNMGFFTEPPPTIVAARAYFENISKLPKHFQFIFSGVPMPGYGWVFPTSETAANVGAGYIVGQQNHEQPASPRAAFDAFLQDDYLRNLLKGAQQISAVKGYPLRTDFARAATFSHRVLLVGEAAGLVNPLTGDGIDYALESGRIAASHLIDMFEAGEFTVQRAQRYDSDLRARYQALFEYCELIQQSCLNRNSLNMLVPAARWLPFLADELVATVLGGKAVPGVVAPIKRARDIFTQL